MSGPELLAAAVGLSGLSLTVAVLVVKRVLSDVLELLKKAPLLYRLLEEANTFVQRAEYDRHVADSEAALDAVERRVSDLGAQLASMHASQLDQWKWEAAKAQAWDRVQALEERLKRLEFVDPSKRERT